jgi:O-methyltransferase
MATYSPWNIDGPFQETYDQIKDHTLVDKYRCFELWQLVEQSSKLPSGSLIEVGVWRGGTGALIAKQAKRCGIRERAFLCDTFSGVVKATSRDSIYKGGEHGDASRLGVERFLSALEIEVGGILEGVFPDQTGRELEDRRFRFCHIDVDTYDSAKDVFEWVWDRLVPGGIVVFDDYGFWSCDGVTAYVEEISAAPDRLVLHNLNGHAVLVKIGL